MGAAWTTSTSASLLSGPRGPPRPHGTASTPHRSGRPLSTVESSPIGNGNRGAAGGSAPVYLVSELGGRPDSAAGRAAWRAAAIGMEAYRAKHGIDDPDSALGPPPADPDPDIELERTAVEQLTRTAVQAIEAVEAPLLPDPDHAHDLAL